MKYHTTSRDLSNETPLIQLLHNSRMALIEWDLDQKLFYFSQNYQDLFSGFSENFDENLFLNRIKTEDRPLIAAFLERLPITKESIDINFRLHDKPLMWIRLSASYIKENGKRKILAILSEINQQKSHEAELQKMLDEKSAEVKQLNNELLKSNRELDQFTYIASHDLQEPLRKIMTFTERFQIKFLDRVPEEGKIFLDKVVSSSQRMSKLIDELLRFSRLTRHAKEMADVDIRIVIEKVIAELEILINQKKAIIEYSKLPVLKGIPAQITQLFTNVVSNALKFTSGNREPVIKINSKIIDGSDLPKEVILRRNRKYHCFRISDNGIGFNQKYADKIFFIFQRIHDKNLFSGSGIGLAICRKIAHNHEGEIIAFSKENEGSVFEIYLPVF